MKYYIKDPKDSRYLHFDNVGPLVEYAETIIQRDHNVNRAQYMQRLAELGHGWDDPTGANFLRSLKEHIKTGIIRGDKYVKKDVHEISNFDKPEFGD